MPPVLPFTHAEDSTFCSSLDSCSSHGFSSLQSPSAFPSFFSHDSSQQIEDPWSLDSAELCCCHRRHCCREAVLDITQDESVSVSNLDILASEEEPLLHHTESQKLACPVHSAPNTTSSRNFEALQKVCIPRGSLLQECAAAEHSISLPSYPESSAFLLIQDGFTEKEQRVFEFNTQFLSSFPNPREQSDLLPSNDSNDVYSSSGYAFCSQIDKIQQFEPYETRRQINDTACIDVHTTQSPSEVVRSVLTSPIHCFPTLISRNGDADDKENFIEAHITGSRESRLRLLDNLSPPCSVEAKVNCKREDKAALQEVHENKKTMYSPCEEMFLNMNAVDEASKENISPHVFEQARKRVGAVKADSNGWMCPKDAKKNFKPKPRQLLLDKWLARQR